MNNWFVVGGRQLIATNFADLCSKFLSSLAIEYGKWTDNGI